MSNLKLHFFVLGDDARVISNIEIASTANVNVLKGMIKEELKLKFDHVPVSDLKLWKVDLPLDETLERSLKSITLDPKQTLPSMAEVLDVLDNPPKHGHLHIVVEGPPAAPSGPLPLKLNCFVLGNEPRHIFQVKIAPMQTVDDLKELIKEKAKPQFDHVPVFKLDLWKVDLPVDDTLERSLKSITLDPKQILSSVAEVLDVLDNPPKHRHLHIVVEGPPAAPSGPLPLKLNCFALGNEQDRVFQVNIAPMQTVNDLKELVKEKMKPQFDDVPVFNLDLWKVKIKLNDPHVLNSLEDEGGIKGGVKLHPVTLLSDVFTDGLENEHIHIIVRRPASTHPPFNLNCFILCDSLKCIFQIRVSQADNVGVLQDLIKDKNREIFRGISAHRLALWSVSLPMDDTLEHNIMNLTLNSKQSLSSSATLFEVFSELPKAQHLHIVVQHPSNILMAPDIPPLQRRLAYFNKDIGSPSTDRAPGAFARTQLQKVYLCNRPRDAAHPVPVTLLDRILAGFVDDCQNRRPTADDDSFVRQLSEKMCTFYDDETSRMRVFREMLSEYGIKLHASTVGSTKCTTDGHLLSPKRDIVIVISEGKNEIGGGGVELFAQALLYYRKLIYGRRSEILKLRTLFPCLNIIVFGACIGIAGSVVTDRIQADILVPIIPLFWHSTDLPMQAMAARTFGALKIAIEKLEELYSQPIPLLEHKDSFLEYPYPLSYTDWTDHIHAFSYDVTQPLREQLIFFGETDNDAARRRLCIKFVRHYSPLAHKFCASKGHAPELIAYNPLLGGWNMVVMAALDIDDYSPPRSGSYRQLTEMTIPNRQSLEGSITSLVNGLHEGGYVHGDLRDTNFFVRDDGKHFMLLDFDWAGPIHMTRYPMHVNRRDVRRPEGARDWEEITVQHDLDMLKYIFHPELDDLEENTEEGPAAKRPRLSSSISLERLSIDD